MAEATAHSITNAFAVAVLARQVARNAVKRQLQASGIKPGHYRASELSVMAEEYIKANRAEVLAQAQEHFANIERFEQERKARKSRASAVQISCSKVEGGI